MQTANYSIDFYSTRWLTARSPVFAVIAVVHVCSLGLRINQTQQCSARTAPPQQVHRAQQHHGANEGDKQRGQAEVILVNGSDADKRRNEPTRQHGAYDTDNDVQNDALLPIGFHDYAGKPADQATNNQPDNEVHDVPFRISMDAGQVVSETRQRIISHDGLVSLFARTHTGLLVAQH